MPRPRPTNPEAEAVVSTVMRRMGLTTAGELAEAAGKQPHADLSPVRQWIRGDVAPSFGYLMEMLSKAGLLQPEAEAAYRGVSLAKAAQAVDEARAKAEIRQRAAQVLSASEEPARRRRRTG